MASTPMKMVPLLLLLLLLTSYCSAGPRGPLPPRLTAAEHHERFQQRAATRSMQPSNLGDGPKTAGRVFYLAGYGADPTGVQDSTDAILAAVSDASKVDVGGRNLLPGVNDLGGVVIDLQGGNYKISKPIRFPSGSGNLVVQGGTLRASGNFPATEYLIELRSPSSHRDATDVDLSNGDPIYYEDVTFRDLLFDSSFRGGGLLIIDSARTRVDNCFFIHFSTSGLTVAGGHETYVSSCFLGQHLTVGGDPHERNFTGTAIELDSNDNSITDVAIFSAAQGIVLRGQANMITNVHCYNKATFFGGVGILVKLAGLGQTRIDNCYMDYTGIVIEDPVQVHVTNAFFLGNAYITLRSVKGKVSGLTIVDNMFSGGGGTTPIVQLDESAGKFTTVEQVVIDRNDVLDMQWKGTAARTTVAGANRTWVADFRPVLVFPDRINHVQYSFYVRPARMGGPRVRRFPVAHAVSEVSDNKVVVIARKRVDAVVSVEVDQYALPGEKVPFV